MSIQPTSYAHSAPGPAVRRCSHFLDSWFLLGFQPRPNIRKTSHQLDQRCGHHRGNSHCGMCLSNITRYFARSPTFSKVMVGSLDNWQKERQFRTRYRSLRKIRCGEVGSPHGTLPGPRLLQARIHCPPFTLVQWSRLCPDPLS